MVVREPVQGSTCYAISYFGPSNQHRLFLHTYPHALTTVMLGEVYMMVIQPKNIHQKNLKWAQTVTLLMYDPGRYGW